MCIFVRYNCFIPELRYYTSNATRFKKANIKPVTAILQNYHFYFNIFELVL